MGSNSSEAIQPLAGLSPSEGELKEIAEGIFWLRFPLPMALDHVNVFAIEDEGGITLVDTGLDTRKTRAIWKRVLAGPMGNTPIRRVILTHHHPDHVGLAGWFALEHGAEIWSTRTTWLMARMLILDEQAVPTAESLRFYRAAGMDETSLWKRSKNRPFNFSDVVSPIPLGYRRIRDRESIRIGGSDWRVAIGNGHAPDHATFWCQNHPLILGGDQFLADISPNIGVYATEPDADPLDEWLESCEQFAKIARPEQTVLPGHRFPYTGLPSRIGQLIDNHRGALKRLRLHLRNPATAVDCFHTLFRRNIDEAEFGLALGESMAHLNYLLARGEVERSRREDGAWLWSLQ
ncbi:MAG: MBL fold metallo-hydrolase [Albidovulum sp.]|nr:MBL fold metallo-hydrolase [Albidovulum sp.]MDE0531610.1 MBL fold metallo-hydrolase [Albidovulum sp.]